MNYDPGNHRNNDCGYRNTTNIKCFVEWAIKKLEGIPEDTTVILIGFKSSGAYLGVSLALARKNTIYISPTIDESCDLTKIYYYVRDFLKVVYVFVDDYISAGTTVDKTQKLCDRDWNKIDVCQYLVLDCDNNGYRDDLGDKLHILKDEY